MGPLCVEDPDALLAAAQERFWPQLARHVAFSRSRLTLTALDVVAAVPGGLVPNAGLVLRTLASPSSPLVPAASLPSLAELQSRDSTAASLGSPIRPQRGPLERDAGPNPASSPVVALASSAVEFGAAALSTGLTWMASVASTLVRSPAPADTRIHRAPGDDEAVLFAPRELLHAATCAVLAQASSSSSSLASSSSSLSSSGAGRPGLEGPSAYLLRDPGRDVAASLEPGGPVSLGGLLQSSSLLVPLLLPSVSPPEPTREALEVLLPWMVREGHARIAGAGVYGAAVVFMRAPSQAAGSAGEEDASVTASVTAAATLLHIRVHSAALASRASALESEAAELTERATSHAAAGRRDEAMHVLRRRRAVVQRLERLRVQRHNLAAGALHVESAADARAYRDVLVATADALRELEAATPARDVEAAQDALEDALEAARELEGLVSREAADGRLSEGDIAELERDMAAMGIGALGAPTLRNADAPHVPAVSDGHVSATQSAAVVAQAATLAAEAVLQ